MEARGCPGIATRCTLKRTVTPRLVQHPALLLRLRSLLRYNAATMESTPTIPTMTAKDPKAVSAAAQFAIFTDQGRGGAVHCALGPHRIEQGTPGPKVELFLHRAAPRREHSVQDIGAIYLKRFGEFLMPNKVEQLLADLDTKLFSKGSALSRPSSRHWPPSPGALPVRRNFAGRSYEADPAKLRAQINSFFVSKEGPR